MLACSSSASLERLVFASCMLVVMTPMKRLRIIMEERMTKVQKKVTDTIGNVPGSTHSISIPV